MRELYQLPKDLMPGNSFTKSYHRVSIAKIEFRHFKLTTQPSIEANCESVERFRELRGVFGFFVDDKDEDRLQLHFGTRSMFRKNADGSVAGEEGPSLLYTIGPTGHVAVIIFPAKSKLAKPFEDHIYLRIGLYGGYQLYNRLRKDIRDMVAYGYVTSLDGDPTWWESLRVWWLRRRHPMQVKGKFTRPAGLQQVGAAVEFSSRTIAAAVLGALLRPLGYLLAIYPLIRFGMPHFADLIKPR